MDGLNTGYAALLLEQYLDNPAAVPPEWRALFEAAPPELLYHWHDYPDGARRSSPVAMGGVTLRWFLDAAWTPTREIEPRLRRLNVVVAGVAIAIATIAVAVRLAQPESKLLSAWPDEAANAVAATAGPDGRVLADDLHSDWLLWRRPDLTGRVAYDVRFELLRERQLAALQTFRDGHGSTSFVAPYRVLTFASESDASRLAGRGTVTYRAPGFVVVRRGR